MKRERNKTFQKLLKTEKDNILHLELSEIELHKDASNQCHRVIKIVKSHKPHKPVSIFDDNQNLITSQHDQLTFITKHFSELFASDDQPEQITLAKIEPEYTAEEIKGVAKKLKNNKATSHGEIHTEIIKYGPPEMYHEIAQVLNITGKTGVYREEIQRGILTTKGE